MMVVAEIAATVLVVVFVWAALMKISRPADTAGAFAELGLPIPGLLSYVVPGAEVAVAALLVIAPVIGAFVAFGMLAVFTALLVSVLRSGRVVRCNCFGAKSDSPVTWHHISRNGLLLVLSGLASTLPLCQGCYLWMV